MQMMKFLLTYMGLALVPLFSMGQHEPIISQYMQNALPLNPAFAGSREAMSIAASYRNQWTGLNGAPTTQTLSLHAPTRTESIAIGGVIYHDQIGVSDRTGINATGAYLMDLGTGKLSFGLSGGLVIGKNSWSEVITTDEGDDVFESGDDNYLLPDFGTGVYYYTSKYYASL
jgi:type IX secretion system PorP/SprF family membrane protein